MADEADVANEIAEQNLQIALAQSRVVDKLHPTGQCFNCEAPLAAGLYCNEECEEEHRWVLERRRQNGR